MPRAKPTQVIEHRLSLSNYERKEVKELLDAQTLNTRIEAGINGAKAVGVVAVGAGTVYVLYQSYLLAREIANNMALALDAAQAAAKKAKEKVVKEYEEQVGPIGEIVGDQNQILKDFAKEVRRRSIFIKPIFKILNPFD
jgi:hypothetical protein